MSKQRHFAGQRAARSLIKTLLRAQRVTHAKILDDFWYLDPSQKVDKYGRWAIDSSKFPHGIAAVADYVHSLGLKFGIYVTPGVPVAAYNAS